MYLAKYQQNNAIDAANVCNRVFRNAGVPVN